MNNSFLVCRNLFFHPTTKPLALALLQFPKASSVGRQLRPVRNGPEAVEFGESSVHRGRLHFYTPAKDSWPSLHL